MNFLDNMGLGKIILLFLLFLFIVWVLTGGSQKERPDNPFIIPQQGEVVPIGTYGGQ